MTPTVAGSSIVLWDHGQSDARKNACVTNVELGPATTFGEEIEFIWWSFTTFLYIVTRYVGDGMFIHGAIGAWASGKFLDMDAYQDLRRSILQPPGVQLWLSQIALLAMQCIVVKRVMCMYGGDRRVLWALALALAAPTLHLAVVCILTSNLKTVVRRIQSANLYEVCYFTPKDPIPSWYWTHLFCMRKQAYAPKWEEGWNFRAPMEDKANAGERSAQG
ncbi:hypothetical protein BKA70DRAFT_1226166 [Coprinopsis sp. MPI-PUGE-AT-0042]|nr:hypothetical protein BKA70DRAFT_1226166 [Coprinopsis sp. MPI-PUGE-AT-0042]